MCETFASFFFHVLIQKQAHIILEEALDRPDGVIADFKSNLGTRSSLSATKVSATEPEQFLYMFSANDRESLQRQISQIASYVQERHITNYPLLLASLAYTLGQRRSLHAWRIAVAASTQDRLIHSLNDNALTPIKATEELTVGFIFTGQGAQWPTMGMSLYLKYPIYKSSLDKASEVLTQLGASWSLVDEIARDKDASVISKPYICQPACTAIQMALVDLFSSCGIKPTSVCGHSSGEIAAAYAAGILGFDTCIAIAYYRGIVSMTLTESLGKAAGGMLAVGASQEEGQNLIDSTADAGVRVACVNSPGSITISGDIGGIDWVQKKADKMSIWNRRLQVDVAYHSHHMDLVSGKYADFLGEVNPKDHVTVDFFSSLKGRKVDSSTLRTSYWVDNLKSPVLFSPAVSELCSTPRPKGARGTDILVEIGPHSALQGPVRQILKSLKGKRRETRYIPSLERNKDDVTSLLSSTSLLWMNGCQLDGGRINFPDSSLPLPSVLTDLPPYQWNHSKRYWHEGRLMLESHSYSVPRHDLLGSRVTDSSSLEPQWSNTLMADDVPWLRQHKVEDVVILPAAAYCCMALEACTQEAKRRDVKYDRVRFREVSINQALVIPDSGSVELRLSLIPFSESSKTVSNSWYQFKIFSWAAERGWLVHSRGLIAAELPPRENDVKAKCRDRVGLERELELLKEQMGPCTLSIDAGRVFDAAMTSGFEVGPMFRGTKQVMIGPTEAKYTATIPNTAACMPYNYESKYVLHPIGLDGLFQGAFYFLSKYGTAYNVPYVPVGIQELTILTDYLWNAGDEMEIYARSSGGDRFSGTTHYDYAGVSMRDGSPVCSVIVKDLMEIPLQGSRLVQEQRGSRCLQLQWEPCMSYLTPSQFEKVLAPCSPDPNEDVDFQIMEDLSYHYIKQALQKTKVENVKAPHLIRLYNWMKMQVQQSNNRNGKILRAGDHTFYVSSDGAKTMKYTAALICSVGEELPAILSGQVDPPSILPPFDPYPHVSGISGYERLFATAVKYFERIRRQTPQLRVLVIGEGLAVAAGASMLQSTSNTSPGSEPSVHFDFGDKNPDFSATVKAILAPIAHLLSHKILDIGESPMDQGFEAGTYDVVIASDMFDASSEQSLLVNVRSLLKVGGQLLSLESNKLQKRLSSFPFATFALAGTEMTNGQEEVLTNGRLPFCSYRHLS